jgi:type II secretory pathway component PulF
MDTPKERGPSTALTVALLGLTLALWVALLGVLIAVVPRYRRAWDDAGQRVSLLAEFAVNLSAWAADWWWVLPLAAVPGLPLAGLGIWAARRSAPEWVNRALLGLAVGVPALLLLAVGAGLALG